MTEQEVSADVFSKMQIGDPIAVYKKMTLGKVEVSVLNPFSGKPENILLYGDPNKNNPKCFIEVWSQKEEVYFDRQNSALFKGGYLEKLKEPVRPARRDIKEKDYSEISREYIEELVTAPFMKFKKELNEIDAEAVLYRVKDVAEELERPEKTMNHIRARIVEVQSLDAE